MNTVKDFKAWDGMMIKFILKIGLGLVMLNSLLMSDPVIPKGDFNVKLIKMAGTPGEFINQKETFPRDYFLINNNLPFLLGLSLHHPMSSSLELSKKQIEIISKIKQKRMPYIIKNSQDIKLLELKLAQNIVRNTNTVKSQYELIDAISKLKTDLTKTHIQCINDVRDILTKEQYEKLLQYATKLVKTKNLKFKIDELVILPHPGKFIKMGRISVDKSIKQKIKKSVKKVYAPIFQGKMREAFDLEKKVQRMVKKGKTKHDLKDTLDEIAKLKREAMDSRIDALNKMQKLLTKEQWNKVNKFTYGAK
ncbi:MAG: hypothetical protein U9N02_03215 [Campylobacterota bacterium]|nr:hypothetical protein [Campylobacterota bacterium]